MKTYANASETLDDLEEYFAAEKKCAVRAREAYVPSRLVVALYRLAEAQMNLDDAGITTTAEEAHAKNRDRFRSHVTLGKWIREQMPSHVLGTRTRKFVNAKETLDALEAILAERRAACGDRWEYLATDAVVALYRLAEVQLSHTLESGNAARVYGSYDEYERQTDRFESHDALGTWLAGQPGADRR